MQRINDAAKRLMVECDDLICAVRENPDVLKDIKVKNIPEYNRASKPIINYHHVGIFGLAISFLKAISMMGIK